MAARTLIIKLGAIGDVLRTTPLLRVLDGEVYWVTRPGSIPILPAINDKPKQVIDINLAFQQLSGKSFDLVLSLDDDLESARLASSVKKDELIGSFWDSSGKISYTDPSATWFDLGLSSKLGKVKADELKKKNKKSYQQIIFKMLGKEFRKEEYLLNFNPFYRDKNKERLLIGIEERAGERWPAKKWNKYSQLGDILVQEGFEIRFFQQRPTLHQYINDISECDLVVCGDTLAMHIALALKIKVVAIFTCTSPAEIFDYGRMIKIVSQLLERAFYSRQYHFAAVDAVSLESVHSAVDKLINNKVSVG